MKKIITAAAIAAMAASLATAEVGVAANIRQGTNLFNYSKEGSKDAKYQINDMAKASWTDDITFSASGEKAGVKALILVDPTVKTGVTTDYAYGWLKYGDNFTVTFGTLDTRGAINVVAPADGNWFNNYCGYGKPGVHPDFKKGKDAGNLTVNMAGDKTNNFNVAYALDNVNLRAVMFAGENQTDGAFSNFNAGLQADAKLDFATVAATVKYDRNGENDDKDVLSAYIGVNPKIIPGLNSLLAFTYYTENEMKAADTLMGVDVRVSYAADALALYTINNITLRDGDVFTYHTLGGSYKVNDVVAAGAQLIANSTATGTWDDDANKKDYLAVRPYVDLTAQKNAILSVGAEYKITNLMGKGDQTKAFTLPVIARVKL